MTLELRRTGAPPEHDPLLAVPQAGAIAVRVGRGEPRVLVVSGTRHPDHWVFPKSHIELGETPAEAAIRQLASAGGVEGDVIMPAGTLELGLEEHVLRIEYFLVRVRRETGTGERRERRWCTLREAAELLTYVGMRELLAAVWPVIARR